MQGQANAGTGGGSGSACRVTVGGEWPLQWRRIVFIILLLSALCARAAKIDFTLPMTPLDWRVEVVAKSPDLKFPTVVACAPDGRVFVGEDYMDMTGQPDKPIDRILCLHPDGKITVFATNLYCIMGMLYLEGKLYVNHCPKVSVFKDGETGTDRVDYFDFTSPRPPILWLTGSRAHIPGNMKAAMDGFIYMAIGDAGFPEMKCPDGRMLELHGGGIIRFRPDGSKTEIFCNGTRNHPDIGINSEDEMFTYENTDDGNGWDTRVSHMVDGGFYGYPYDHKPRQPYTLWMMTDYGGGAGTGGICYNEDALPEEYWGNYFCEDYARSQVLRLKVARNGGTYTVTERTLSNGADFMSQAATEFRPVSIALSPDGRSFYVTDWQTYMCNVQMELGRLLRVTYLGANRAATKPAWFVPAASGKNFQATTVELTAGLAHPAQSVRLAAQRQLTRRGTEAATGLTTLLADKKAPAYARWSALWALDGIDGGLAARPAILAVLQDLDPSLRRQALRQLGTRQAAEALGPARNLLKDVDATVRFHAATALGRIGNKEAVPALLERLVEKDFYARYAVFTALNRIGKADGTAWKAIAAGLKSTNPAITQGALFAMRATYAEPLLGPLNDYALDKSNPTATRAEVIGLITEMALKPPKWDGQWWGTDVPPHPVLVGPPAKVVAWEATTAALQALQQSAKDADRGVRLAALKGLQKTKDKTAAVLLQEVYRTEKDFELRQVALQTLGDIRDPSLKNALVELLDQAAKNPNDAATQVLLPLAVTGAEKLGGAEVSQILVGALGNQTDARVLLPVLGAVASLKPAGAGAALKKLIGNSDARVSQQAIDTVAQIAEDSAAGDLLESLKDPKLETRKRVVNALGKLKAKMAMPALMQAAQTPELRDDAIVALAQTPDMQALMMYVQGLGNPSPQVREACTKAIAAIQKEALPALEAQNEASPLPPQILEQLRYVKGVSQIGQFYVLGPIKDEPDTQDPLALHPINSRFVDPNGQVIAWKQVTAKPLTGNLSLAQNLGLDGKASNMTAIIATPINSPLKQQLGLLVTGGQPFSVWANGQKMHGQTNAVETATVPLDLNGGQNLVALRMQRVEAVKTLSMSLSRPIQVVEPTPKGSSPEAYAYYAMPRTGKTERGRQIFFDLKGVACFRCHKIGNEGGDLGPALSGIGAKYNKTQLMESVLYPSRYILNGYQQTAITTKSGDTEIGLVRSETADQVVLADSAGTEKKIAKSQIAKRAPSDISLMPEGLQLGLTFDDFIDLITYLESLRDRP